MDDVFRLEGVPLILIFPVLKPVRVSFPSSISKGKYTILGLSGIKTCRGVGIYR